MDDTTVRTTNPTPPSLNLLCTKTGSYIISFTYSIIKIPPNPWTSFRLSNPGKRPSVLRTCLRVSGPIPPKPLLN